jgi:hypothetical protein
MAIEDVFTLSVALLGFVQVLLLPARVSEAVPLASYVQERDALLRTEQARRIGGLGDDLDADEQKVDDILLAVNI